MDGQKYQFRVRVEFVCDLLPAQATPSGKKRIQMARASGLSQNSPIRTTCTKEFGENRAGIL